MACALTSQGQVVTGSADKTIKIVTVEGLPAAAHVNSAKTRLIKRAAPVICVAVHHSGSIALCGCKEWVKCIWTLYLYH